MSDLLKGKQIEDNSIWPEKLNFSVGSLLSFIDLTNTVMTNCNQSTVWTIVAWLVTTPISSLNTSDYTITNNAITIVNDWYYKIGASMFFSSTWRRVNVWVEILVNWVAQAWLSASDYIRSMSWHNEASTTVKDRTLSLSTGDEIQFNMIRLAATGTVTAVAWDSVFTVHRIK